ncbi:MAG: hypothetical protein N4A74_03350 [Carboxylicivirga sp.]|nr:hypothetical protein [Carboxylicivirga sp.]
MSVLETNQHISGTDIKPLNNDKSGQILDNLSILYVSVFRYYVLHIDKHLA